LKILEERGLLALYFVPVKLTNPSEHEDREGEVENRNNIQRFNKSIERNAYQAKD